MTVPSAGATTARSSAGGVRSGLRKKYSVNRVRATKRPVRVYSTAEANITASIAQITAIPANPIMKGYPSVAMGVFWFFIKPACKQNNTPLLVEEGCLVSDEVSLSFWSYRRFSESKASCSSTVNRSAQSDGQH